STFVFNGGGSQVFGTYNWRPDNTFYNLIVENNSNVQSTHNVLVLNDMEVSDGSSFNIDSGKTLNVIGEIIGDANIETNRPYIITIVINTMNSITAVFNEPLDPVSAQTASNYRIEDKNGNTINNPINPLLGGVNNNEVTLTLGFDIQQDVTYYLIVNNVYNLNNFAVNSNHKKRFLLKEDKDLWQWSGAIDNDWDKPGNWSKNKIPKTSSQVVIPVTVNNPVILSLNNTISKLQIKTGASLTIGPMGSLLVSDSILNSEGEAGLIIASTSEGTGSLVHFNDDVNATFQRYISGEPQAWQMISSPIAGQSISGDFTPTGGSDAYGDGTRYDFYTWYEPDTSWVYLLNDDQAPTWLTANGSSNFVTGKGYLISYKDLHPTKEFKGLLNNGTVSVQLTNTHNGAIQFGHNLLGNPYPSSIDWKATSGWNRDVLEDNNGGYDFWVWSEENLNYGVYNSASSSDIGTLGVSRYIAPTQGFFVKAKQSGAFSMNNQVRVSDGASNWLKSSIAVQNNISITIESLAGSGQDEVRIEFGYRETEGGALKKFSFVPSSPSLFLPADGEFYSIRSLSEPENHPVVPLSFKAGVSGSYKISANFSLNDFETLILIDRQTGVRHNFNESKTYDFSANSNDKPERFVLQVMPGEYANPYEVLPVHIFTAEKRLNIDLRLIEGEYICEVFSITGQILIKSNVYGGELTTLEIPSLSGVFMVQVSGKQGRKSQKVVVY
ncbi:MAG: T9SS type A sorting domain-containing protein, partial [Prolixibacteraceae bacterium]|nr:T9SS type A sorting domain-containing protein [Prolixibacteraceae bacterium]